ncbi:MAG: DMT family transporter [Candidatus Marinimicrobia bacterium]|nr:DMT family transporter [Candidatus Neomarinimicrobiota bacterium]
MNLTRGNPLLPELVLLLAVFIWGATFTVVKQALEFTSPFMFMTLRFAIALAIISVASAPRLGAITRRELLGGAITGVALFAGFAFQTWGLVYTSASKSAFITGLNVVLVPIMLFGFNRRPIAGKRWAAVGLATLGLLLLTDPTSAAGLNRGDVLTVGCAAAFAGQIIFLSIYAPTVNTLRYFWVQLITVTTLAAAATLAVGGWRVTPTATLWWSLGITGVLGTALAFLAQTWAQRRTSPTRTALILTMEPVVGALFAVVVAGETLPATAWLGGIIVVAAIVWSELGVSGREALRTRGATPEP